MLATRSREDDLAEMRHRVRSTPTVTDRDKELASFIRYQVRDRRDWNGGCGSKVRGLFVVGESNSGKSYSIKRQISNFADFADVVNEFGETVKRLLVIVCPRSSNERTLPTIILEAMSIEVDGNLNAKELDKLMCEQLKLRGVWFIWFDEAQHLVRADTEIAKQKIQNSLKMLLQMEDHAVYVILSGVPAVLGLRKGDGQISTRSFIMPFRQLTEADRKVVKKWLCEIAATCSLDLDEKLAEDEFAERLIRASLGALGTIIETIQYACLLACDRNSKIVTVDEFARYYTRTSGCRRNENMFTAADWRSLNPTNAMSDMETTTVVARQRKA